MVNCQMNNYSQIIICLPDYSENAYTMKMYKICLRIVLFLAVSVQGMMTAAAQSGDQILDGIGETGLIARYLSMVIPEIGQEITSMVGRVHSEIRR